MENLITVLGTEEIDGNQFTGIEGGFGEGKRSMLVRDIADANGTTTKKLNQNIERNRKRFKNGVDLLDLKDDSGVTVSDLKKMKYSQSAINGASHIYLLSERGYAKLLKIMDSDEAWNQYDKFVDGYFQYRELTRNAQKPLTLPDQIQTIALGYGEMHEDVEAIKDDVQELKDNEEIRSWERKQLLSIRREKVLSYLTGINDPDKFKSARSKLYQAIGSDFKRQFNLPAYDALPRKQFQLGRDFMLNWVPDEWTRAAIAGMELTAQEA